MVEVGAADPGQSPARGRSRARGLVLQALYQWVIAGHDPVDIEAQFHADRDVGIEVLQWGSYAKSMEILNGRKGKASHVDKMLGDIRKKIGRIPAELRNGFRPS